MAKKVERAPQYYASPLNNPMLNYSEYYMSAFEKILYTILVIIAGGVAGFIFYGGLFKSDGEATMATYISNLIIFVVVGLVAAKIFVPVINKMLLAKRNKKLENQFMNFLETLATSLSAGSTMHDAVISSKDDLLNQFSEKDMIIVELKEIIAGIENGITMEDMLANFGARSYNENIVNFSNVISNCYRLGGNFSSVVRNTRELISDKIAVADEIATKVSSNKLQLNAMSLMPIALVGMLKMTSGDFASNLASPVGVIVTTIAIGIFAAAYIWGQKIINIR